MQIGSYEALARLRSSVLGLGEYSTPLPPYTSLRWLDLLF